MLSALQFSIFQKLPLEVLVLLEKVFLEIWQNPQENTCDKVCFSIKLQTEAIASDLSRVFSWRFLVYFISTEKWNEKKENTLTDFKYLLIEYLLMLFIFYCHNSASFESVFSMKTVKRRLFKKYLERRKSRARFCLSLAWLHISEKKY